MSQVRAYLAECAEAPSNLPQVQELSLEPEAEEGERGDGMSAKYRVTAATLVPAVKPDGVDTWVQVYEATVDKPPDLVALNALIQPKKRVRRAKAVAS